MFPHSGSVQQGSHQESGNHAFFSQNSGSHWDKVPSFLISPTRLSSGIREPCFLVVTKFWRTLGQGSLIPDQFRWVPSFLIRSTRISSGIREPCLFVCLSVCLNGGTQARQNVPCYQGLTSDGEKGGCVILYIKAQKEH